MSVFNEEKFKEGLVSELALFDLPSTQTSVNDIYYDEIRPLSQVSGDSPFEFKISGQNSMDYLDLKNSQIYVRLKVEKSDGTALTNVKVEKVGPANLFLQSLFSTAEVTLQNKATITCNYNPYRAYMQTLLNYGSDAITSQLDTQLFIRDDADSPGVTDPNGNNNGLFLRAQIIGESKRVDLQGPIFHDLFSMERYLINQVDVKVKLYRSPPEFCLLTGDGSHYKVNIEDIYILARKIRVNPAVIYGHSKILEKQNALYPYDKVEVRSVSMSTGLTNYSWENMFQGRRPNKIILGFVKSRALSGDYKTNPFNFENCSIQQIAIYCDGLPIGGNPLKLDFDAAGGTAIMRAYTNLLLSSGKWRQDEGNLLDRSHYLSGSTLFVFQLEPNFSHHGEYLSLVKTGNVRLDVVFKTPLTEPISCLAYSEGPGYFEINHERDIIIP
ncbi:uncharacterized protein F54H12.2-like [Ruditapes philippinarum]|uniref:uncharacterized protein F54H12.2-like n=1 Tax=Ruditapes philippinarum TaxID=129788 RepID=UPI00295BE913|nr:uncharacterized protein F54H12.2-like [Ruditapes philippinarum]